MVFKQKLTSIGGTDISVDKSETPYIGNIRLDTHKVERGDNFLRLITKRRGMEPRQLIDEWQSEWSDLGSKLNDENRFILIREQDSLAFIGVMVKGLFTASISPKLSSASLVATDHRSKMVDEFNQSAKGMYAVLIGNQAHRGISDHTVFDAVAIRSMATRYLAAKPVYLVGRAPRKRITVGSPVNPGSTKKRRAGTLMKHLNRNIQREKDVQKLLKKTMRKFGEDYITRYLEAMRTVDSKFYVFNETETSTVKYLSATRWQVDWIDDPFEATPFSRKEADDWANEVSAKAFHENKSTWHYDVAEGLQEAFAIGWKKYGSLEEYKGLVEELEELERNIDEERRALQKLEV